MKCGFISRTRFIRPWPVTILLRIALMLAVGVAGAQCGELDQAPGSLDAKDLEAFLDRFFAEQMAKLHFPGAVFLLVRDGKVFLAKGYGYADLERKTPVVPDRTAFRVGSVSKLFTATAVMQLWEKRKLNLKDDVNRYLKSFQLASNYSKPVTINDLMTHTAGFDEQFIGKAARTPFDLISLGPYLARRMPPRLWPPGEFISYSNHSYALLGLIVEETSGVSFEQYVYQNILNPLGMTRSSFHQPPPATLAPDIAVGYVFRDGTYQPVSLDFLNDAPAGSLITTATDVAQFMIAHLEEGHLGGVRILDAASAEEMHRAHFAVDRRLPGVCYGFWEYSANGERAIQHDGGWTGFYSLLFLLPAHRLGFFVAVNSLDLQDLSQQVLGEELTRAFLDRYYPPRSTQGLPADSKPQGSLERFAGSYCGRIPPRHTFEKALTLFTQSQVSTALDGSLTISSSPFSGPTKWVPVDRLLFRQKDGSSYVTFREDADGRIVALLDPETSWRLPWYENASLNFGLIGFFAFIFLSTVSWPAAYAWRTTTGKSVQGPRLHKTARVLASLSGAMNLTFLLGFGAALQNYPNLVWYGVPFSLTLLLTIPCLTAGLTACVIGLCWFSWRDKYWSLFHRFHYSLVTLASLAFVGFLLHWNLLGFHY